MDNHIKLYEIAATAKNFEMFKAKYKENVPDEQLKSIFDRFTKQQSRLQIKDIFKYASLKDLTSALETKSGKEVEKSIKTSEANIIIDNEKMMIVEPLTMAASFKYGANTKWCTTWSDPAKNRFNNYFGDYTLVYFIDKIHNTKYAIAYDKNNQKDTQAFDEENEFINSSKILKIFNVSLEEISSKTISVEEKNKVLKKNFSKDMERRIVGDVIKGDVSIENKNLKKITDIFDFSKIEVTGNFICFDNKLTTLEGAPRKVGMGFYCHNNQLTSLEGAPQQIGFFTTNSRGGTFNCSNNKLTSLKGAPQSGVGGGFYCDKNQLTSLAGAPREVGGDFYCQYNQLVSLTDVPVKVGGTFNCSDNKLTSLTGAPREVRGDVYCDNNQLTSLTDVPIKVGGDFFCSNNPTKFSKEDMLKAIKEDVRKAMRGEVSEIFIQKENNMDKIQPGKDMISNLKYRDFYPELKEYYVGQSAGYGGGAMTGGGVAANNWAGTFSSNQTSRRLQNYPAQRKYTYTQGNTIIGSPLYGTLTDDDLIDPNFTKDEIRTGLRYEMKRMEYPDKDVAKPTVLKNLHKNPKYYSDLEMYFQSDKI